MGLNLFIYTSGINDTIKIMFGKIFSKKNILVLIILVASFLRLFQINKVPVSLFGDELDLGYQAYSILKTGKDYDGIFLPLHFRSLAEWRTPLYLYSAVPTVAIFGISPLGVRLPAAIFGILSILSLYLLIKEITDNENLALVSAALLTFSPWHIQYSRAGFEVTELLFLLILALYYFLKSIKNKGKGLWLSSLLFALTPWVYSTAKFFVPLLLVFLLIAWWKEIMSFSKKTLFKAAIVLLIVGGPIAYSTLFGGGTQRFGYISIFTDPVTEAEVGVARQNDARVRGEKGEGLTPTIIDRAIHNKFTFWGEGIISNYIQSFSTNFLFVKGDINLRHSIGLGEFYRIEFPILLLGIILFFTSKIDKKYKSLIIFWIFAGVLPAAITREGGQHATRLIIILPPLIFLVAYGIYESVKRLKGIKRLLFIIIYLLLFLFSFFLYQHDYWFHYPWKSERWWHAGYEEGIKTIKELEKDYDRVVVSTANEPPWIFFAGWYEYPPDKWQKEFPIDNVVKLEGFGDVSHIDKFYFGSPSGSVYEWGKVIDNKTLYLASEKEVRVNLIMEPERTPGDLSLIKAIAYPSGEPAFYLFTGKSE